MFEERIAKILQIVNERNTASVAALAAEIGTSESTIRRDIIALDKRGQLKRCLLYTSDRNRSPRGVIHSVNAAVAAYFKMFSLIPVRIL